jgi:hypothetical protein
MSDNNENNYESLVPVVLTGLAAIWLGLNKKGNLLDDIAVQSISRAVQGKKPLQNTKHKRFNKHRGKSRRKKETTV